jgi:hypothetical protein
MDQMMSYNTGWMSSSDYNELRNDSSHTQDVSNIDANDKPSKNVKDFWIHFKGNETTENYDQTIHGKWMMFIDGKDIDKKWKTAKMLAMDGNFEFYDMKVSTKRPNPRASSKEYVIIVYTNGTEESILKAGKKIARLMNYESLQGRMYYKTEEQTVKGTVKTGTHNNTTFYVLCEKKSTPYMFLDV